MITINEKFTYHTLIRKDLPTGRVYECPDGKLVASVTTILEATKPENDKKTLENWRNRVGVDRAKEVTKLAANRGTRIHAFLEGYIKTGQIKESVSNPYAQESLSMAKTIINSAFHNINEVWGSEVSIFYPELYAGTTDLIGVYNSKPSIMDFKQTNKPKKREWIESYFLQLLFYATAHNKLYGTNIKQGVIMMCSTDCVYQEFILDEDEWDKYENLMWDRLETYYKYII